MSEEGRRRLSRARAALEAGRADAAVREARLAVAASPTAEGFAVLARAFLAEGRPQEALDAASSGLGLRPDSEWLHRLRGTALLRLKRSAEALEAVDESLRCFADGGQAHYLRSLVLASLKRLPEAQESAERAVALDPQSAANLAQLADVHLAAGRHARAEALYRQSLSLEPTNAECLNNLGVALERQKRLEEAAMAYKSAFLLDPRLEVAKRNTHGAVHKLVGPAGMTVLAVVAIQALVRIGGALGAAAGGLALVVLAVALAVRHVRRRRALERLAEREPQLHGIYLRIDQEMRGRGRLRRRRAAAVAFALLALLMARSAWAGPSAAPGSLLRRALVCGVVVLLAGAAAWALWRRPKGA